MSLPREFVFGAATAAYQIEGGVGEDGRIASIWDTFSHTPGAVLNGDTGDVACDHRHRWREDVTLMRELGLDAYRLSLAWPRLLDAHGNLLPDGVAFYRDLLGELKAAGIRTFATLYHWDLPQYLQDAGGWASRETAYAFARYARTAAQQLGDLVDMWATLNEPWCSAFLGYAAGVHAPGLTDQGASLAAAHHLNLAHGLAVQALREELGPETQVGVVLNLHVIYPEDPFDDSHLDAVHRVEMTGNHIFLGPMLAGTYPTDLVAATRHLTDWSFVHTGDLEIARQRLDFLGVNYYSVNTVRPGTGPVDLDAPTPWVAAPDVEFCPAPEPTTAMGWTIEPEGLYDLLRALDNAYPDVPLIVAENGAAFPDVLSDDAVHDPDRIDYLRAHLDAVERAVAGGAHVIGYFAWSLLDNFEWAFGYSKRFGLIYVDYPTQRRVPKDSALWYRDVIAAQRRQREQVAPVPPEPDTPVKKSWRDKLLGR